MTPEKEKLNIAINTGDLDAVKEIYKEFPSIIKNNTKKGYTPLIHAIIQKQNKIIKYLIEIGIDVNELDDENDNALIFASHNGNTTVIKMLLKAGADIDIRGYEKRTALFNAVAQNRGPAVKMLLRAGADVTIRNEYDTTPREYAVSFKKKRALKELDDLTNKNYKKLGKYADLLGDI